MGFIVADFSEHIVGVLDNRRAFSLMDRGYFLHHICNLIGIGNNDFFCLFSSQIRKFLQHFLCGPQV